MIDVLDLVDVPHLGLKGCIVIGRTYGTNTCTVQDKAGIEFEVAFDEAVHSDPVKRKHAERPLKIEEANRTRPTVEESEPGPSDRPHEESV